MKKQYIINESKIVKLIVVNMTFCSVTVLKGYIVLFWINYVAFLLCFKRYVLCNFKDWDESAASGHVMCYLL